MSSSREIILRKLRAAQQPFPDAPPRPAEYRPVTTVEDNSPDGLLARFTSEVERLTGQVFVVDGDEAATACILDLLQSHQAKHILAWDFRRIPVKGLSTAIRKAKIEISQPDMHDEFRAETLEGIRDAQVGLTGVDAALASTGTLVVSTAPGRGRLPTVLAPVFLAVMTLDQLLPNVEAWVARERAKGMDIMRERSNVCFITGPSRTADIEMELVLQVHGPGKVQVVVKR